MSKKKLTITDLKNKNKKFEEKKSVEIDGYTFNISQYFKPSLVQDVIYDLQKRIVECEKNEIEVDPSIYSSYLWFLIIKKFTDALDGIKFKENDFEKELMVVELLIDAEYFIKIIESFPESEIQKVSNMVENTEKLMNAIILQQEVIQEEGQEEEQKEDEKGEEEEKEIQEKLN